MHLAGVETEAHRSLRRNRVRSSKVGMESPGQGGEAAIRSQPQRTPYSILSKMFLSALVRSPRKFALAQSAVNLVRTACALERHRLANGKYPETLDALAPQFIAKVPRDPISGQPLHYRAVDGQFVLYSVGWNEKDDGGIVSLTKRGTVDFDRGDWVWRYPEMPKL